MILINKDKDEKLVEKIKKHVENKKEKDLYEIDAQYVGIISEPCFDHPYMYTHEMRELANKLRANTEYETAQNIYQWIVENIKYVDRKLKYNSIGTFLMKEGNCAEMSFLFITLTRLNDIRSDFLLMLRDYYGNKVSHGCCYFKSNDQEILVDPAYKLFNPSFKLTKNISILYIPDDLLYPLYHLWKGNKGGTHEPVRKHIRKSLRSLEKRIIG